jgi:hypothetical protein
MPSAKEMRCWIILGLLLFWANLAWMFYDQLTWVPGGSPQETLRQVQCTTLRLDWSRLVGLGYGALMLTRMAYCVLRVHRHSERA